MDKKDYIFTIDDIIKAYDDGFEAKKYTSGIHAKNDRVEWVKGIVKLGLNNSEKLKEVENQEEVKTEEVENQEEVKKEEVKQLSSEEKIDIMLKTRGAFRDDIIELLKVELEGEKTQNLKDVEDLFQKAMITLYEADEVLKYGNPLEFIEGKEEAAKKEIEEFVDSLNEIQEDATFYDLMQDSENIGSLDICNDELDGFVSYLERKSERTSDEESALDRAHRLTDEIAEANSQADSAQEIAHELFDKLEVANELLRDCARVQSEMRNEFVD
ncbi:hypothetical protein N8508_00245 [bacterium]|nr:hypothetical protein [bacterium]